MKTYHIEKIDTKILKSILNYLYLNVKWHKKKGETNFYKEDKYLFAGFENTELEIEKSENKDNYYFKLKTFDDGVKSEKIYTFWLNETNEKVSYRSTKALFIEAINLIFIKLGYSLLFYSNLNDILMFDKMLTVEKLEKDHKEKHPKCHY
jgi:hypothetical protein